MKKSNGKHKRGELGSTKNKDKFECKKNIKKVDTG